MAELVASDDPDVAAYGDVGDFFLKAAGEAIRSYCGWQLSPPVTDTRTLDVRERGIIMLPATHVTEVSSVVLGDRTLVQGQDFHWAAPQSWVELCTWRCARQVTITFTSGFDPLPLDLKVVALELASTATTLPAGNVNDISSPGYRILFDGDLGTSLSASQQSRLAKYRVGGFR